MMNLQNKTLPELQKLKAIFETSNAHFEVKKNALRKVNYQIAQLNGQRKAELIRDIEESLAEIDVEAF